MKDSAHSRDATRLVARAAPELRGRSRRASRGAAALAFLLAFAAPAAGQFPPDATYLRFETPHFRVIFPEGMEPFARRAAARAEWAHAALSERFIEPPSGRIALVITDYTDQPNASATPLPSNRVVVIATPDLVSRSLNYYTDWLDVTLVHELTHIFHLDRADGIWSLGQAVFGRVPFLFPAFYQPSWVIEGLPSYYESRLTGAGRAYGSYFDELLVNGAVAGEFLPVDAADGLSPIWPAGQTPYAYGGLFFRAQAEEHGDSAVAAFARRGAARLPYTLEWAAGPFFGDQLSHAWKRWSRDYQAAARARADSLRARGLRAGTPLTATVWNIAAPRYSPDGRYLAMSFFAPSDDPATLVIDAESGRVVRRERRNSTGGNSWARDGSAIYLDQVEYADRYDLYGDIYALDASRGGARRLTRGGRLTRPDVAPDGRSLVAVETGEGSNRLVLIDLERGGRVPLTPFAAGVNWNAPRWSPDGMRIAVERWVEGSVLDIVVVDREGRVVRQVTRDAAADMTPAWSPDGRFLLWASDRDGASDIYALEIRIEPDESDPAAGVWRVTRTLGGALEPDVAPDGRWLAYVALEGDGVRVERVRLDPATWEAAGPALRDLRGPALAGPRPASLDAGTMPVRPYSPFPSLWPKFWLPLVFTGDTAVGTFFGLATSGTDDVRRHAYALLLGWRSGVEEIEGAFAYSYAGLGDPVLSLTASQAWDEVRVLTADEQIVGAIERERELRVAAGFFRPRIRSAFAITPSLALEMRRFEPLDSLTEFGDPTQDDVEARVLVGFSTARRHPRSVSPEQGLSASVTLAHERLAHDFDLWRSTVESVVRAYASFHAFGFAHHVIAARLAAGYSQAHERGPEIFELGGIPGQPLGLLTGLSLGEASDYPIRGLDEGYLVGDRIVAGSIEYRFPLWLVARGYGLWPLTLDKLSGSFFFDVGSAWFDPDDPEVISSGGAELSVDLGLGYSLVSRLRAGVAFPIRLPQGASRAAQAYLGVGLAF
jgi:Tol biopolymer transport system component